VSIATRTKPLKGIAKQLKVRREMKQGRGSRPDSCIEQGRAFVNPAPVAELDWHFGLVQL